MRKFVSVVFAIVFLLSLPGLLRVLRSNGDQAQIMGYCLFSFGVLAVAIYFWRTARKDTK